MAAIVQQQKNIPSSGRDFDKLLHSGIEFAAETASSCTSTRMRPHLSAAASTKNESN
jgi:hypothetical protein